MKKGLDKVGRFDTRRVHCVNKRVGQGWKFRYKANVDATAKGTDSERRVEMPGTRRVGHDKPFQTT